MGPERAPQGEAPKGGGPKISRFSFPSPTIAFSFCPPSLGVLLVEFWWCLKCGDPNARSEFRGFSRQPESSNVRVPAFKNTTKIQRRTPGEKIEDGGRRGTKRAKFWAVRRRGVPRRAVPGRAGEENEEEEEEKNRIRTKKTKKKQGKTRKQGKGYRRGLGRVPPKTGREIEFCERSEYEDKS